MVRLLCGNPAIQSVLVYPGPVFLPVPLPPSAVPLRGLRQELQRRPLPPVQRQAHPSRILYPEYAGQEPVPFWPQCDAACSFGPSPGCRPGHGSRRRSIEDYHRERVRRAPVKDHNDGKLKKQRSVVGLRLLHICPITLWGM